MPDDVFRTTLNNILRLSKANKDPNISILWHGGEPMQFDIPMFEKRLVEANNFFFAQGVTVTHCMQTALINYNKEWSRILKTYFNSWASVSIDLKTRELSGSAERYNAVLEKRIEAAQQDGIYLVGNVCPSVDDVGREAELLDWLERNNIASFSIDRYNSFGGSDTKRPANSQHSSFLASLLDDSLMRIRESRKVSVCSTLQAGIAGVLYGRSGDRWGVSCLKDYIVVNPDGRTNTCPDKISVEETYSRGKDFYLSDKRAEVIGKHATTHPTQGCFSCEFFSWCKSGCPITPNDWGSEGECSGYKLFLKKIQVMAEDELELLNYYIDEKQ
jgi:radical SAM protein with 4Fe4S-binding SPASM domain